MPQPGRRYESSVTSSRAAIGACIPAGPVRLELLVLESFTLRRASALHAREQRQPE
jgi:hypothetical protein